MVVIVCSIRSIPVEQQSSFLRFCSCSIRSVDTVLLLVSTQF